MKRKLIIILLSTSLALLLTGCGFKPRSPEDVPPALRVLYLDSPNPYAPLTVQLERALKALKVRFVNSPHEAPVTLRIVSNAFTYTLPNIVNSGMAYTYSYRLFVTYELENAKGTIIYGPRRINISRSLLQNANQLYTPNATQLMKQEVTRTTVLLIYYDLISYHKKNKKK